MPVYLNVFSTTFLSLTLHVSFFCTQAHCWPASSDCVFHADYHPHQYPHPSLSRLSRQRGLLSAQNYLRTESSHTDSRVSLIRTVSHRWQRPRSSLGDSTPLPSIYSAHHVAVQTLYQQQLESVFRSWGHFFFSPSRNKSALSKFEVLAFCDCRGIKPHGPSPYRSDTHCQLPLTIPALSYLCFCSVGIFFFFFRVRLCT